jgi:hypothetical protein
VAAAGAATHNPTSTTRYPSSGRTVHLLAVQNQACREPVLLFN